MSPEAQILLKKLRMERRAGKITPENPITGKELARLFNLKFATNLTDVDFRAFVNELRCDRHPIASTGEGYFYALEPLELDHTKAQLKSRMGKIGAALHGLEKAFLPETDDLFNTPQGKILVEQLGLERVEQ